MLNSGKPSDRSSFTLVRTNKRTGHDLIEGQQTVVGAERAKRLKAKLDSELSAEEIEAGWIWEIRPKSKTGSDRLVQGYRRGFN